MNDYFAKCNHDFMHTLDSEKTLNKDSQTTVQFLITMIYIFIDLQNKIIGDKMQEASCAWTALNIRPLTEVYFDNAYRSHTKVERCTFITLH